MNESATQPMTFVDVIHIYTMLNSIHTKSKVLPNFLDLNGKLQSVRMQVNWFCIEYQYGFHISSTIRHYGKLLSVWKPCLRVSCAICAHIHTSLSKNSHGWKKRMSQLLHFQHLSSISPSELVEMTDTSLLSSKGHHLR